MAFFRSERGIGRGELAESRLDVPFLAAFFVCCALAIVAFHFYVNNQGLTIALVFSLFVFGLTLARVDLGIYLLVTAMLLSPEVNVGQMGGAGERDLNLRYDDFLIIVIFVGVLVKMAFEGRETLWRPNPINVGICLYYGMCVVSTLRAADLSVPAYDKRLAFFVMLKMAEFYMVFVLTATAVRTQAEIRNYLTFFFLVATIVCGFGIYSIFGLERVTAPFEATGAEPNTFGGYLVLIMSLAGGLMVAAPSRSKKLLFLGLIVLAFIPFVKTLSRASYIAFLVALLALGLAGRRIAVIACLLLVLCLFPLLAPEDIQDRVNYTFQRGSGQPLVIAGMDTGLQVDKSTHERIYVWDKVRYNLIAWPWIGGGVTWDRVLDSQYALVIIETGILGLAAFLFMQYRILRVCRDAHRWSRNWIARGLGLGVLTASIGLIVHSLGTISFLIIRIMEPFWFILALTVVARDLAIEEHRRRSRVQNGAAAAPAAPAGALPARGSPSEATS